MDPINQYIAYRNQVTREWLAHCTETFRSNLCECYAIELRCPLCEIDPEFESQEDLNWLYERFGSTIKLFDEDRLTSSDW